MFVYQTKIDGKDGLVLVSETTDAGKQVKTIGQEVLVVIEDGGVLKTSTGSIASDGTFTPAN